MPFALQEVDIPTNRESADEDSIVKTQSLKMLSLGVVAQPVTAVYVRTFLAAVVVRVAAPKVQFKYVAESDQHTNSVANTSSRLSTTPNVNEQFL
jgi:hypothetical protein